MRSAAIELPRINLADALAIVLLMAADEDPAYERAATRWLTRLASERPTVTLQDLAEAAAALLALRGAHAAHAALAELCARYDVGTVIGLPGEGAAQRGRARP